MDLNSVKAGIEKTMEDALSAASYHKVRSNKDYLTRKYFDAEKSEKEFSIIGKFTVDVEIEVVNSLDEVKNYQTVVIFTDEIVNSMGNKVDPAGVYFNNGVCEVEVQCELAETIRVACHELGHDRGMSDLYKTSGGKVTEKRCGLMGTVSTYYFCATAIGEFCQKMCEIVWTSKKLDPSKTKHDKTYSSGSPKNQRSQDAKNVNNKCVKKGG